MIALGLAAQNFLERQDAVAFLQGALTLGGGLIICGLFSLKMHWHGLIGAGVLALLATARGLGNLQALAKLIAGDHSRGPAPWMELAVTLISLALLLRVLRVLQREKIRRMLEED